MTLAADLRRGSLVVHRSPLARGPHAVTRELKIMSGGESDLRYKAPARSGRCQRTLSLTLILHERRFDVGWLDAFEKGYSAPLVTRGEVPYAPASVKALRPLRGAQDRAALTDASAPGGALT